MPSKRKVSTLYTKIVAEAEKKGQQLNGTKRSIAWLRDRAQQVSMQRVAPSRMLTDRPARDLRFNPRIGDMMMFVYDPKLKKELPYYDTFPLIFPIKKVKGGFHGINMHYLPPRHRALLMDALLKGGNLNNTEMDETTRMQLNYATLKAAAEYKYFRPCYKHYLDKHVQSRFIWIHPEEWQFALFLPTERFKKATKEEVWTQSKRVYRGNNWQK